MFDFIKIRTSHYSLFIYFLIVKYMFKTFYNPLKYLKPAPKAEIKRYCYSS